MKYYQVYVTNQCNKMRGILLVLFPPLQQALFNRDYLLWMKGQDFSDETLAVVEMAIKGKPLPKPQEWDEMLGNGSWRDILVESSQPVQQTGWDVTPMPEQQQQQQVAAVPNGVVAAT